MGACASNQAAGAKDEHDYAKIESYLMAHTSLGRVLSAAELWSFARCFHLVDFVAGVSLCADGDVGRDWYLLAEGEVSIFVEEELFCAKNAGDYMCMAARYPAGSNVTLAGAPPLDEAAAAKLARLSRGTSVANDKAGFGQCLAVSTSAARVVHLPRERWIEFERTQSAAGSRVCERIYPLLVEPTPSIAPLHFFRGLSARMLQLVGLMFRAVYLHAGATLFSELDEGASLFIVASGSAEAYVQLEDGSEKRLKQFGKGEMMGEIALIMNVPRTASVRATSDSLLLELHRDNFKRFIRLVPTGGNIHAVMKSRTAEHFRKYKIPFFNSIPEEKYILLAELCKIEQIEAGSVVFKEGDPADCFYIIAHGEMKVTVKGKQNHAALANGTGTGAGAGAGPGIAVGDGGVEMAPVPAAGGRGRGMRGSLLSSSPPASNGAFNKRGSIVGESAAAASSDAAIVDPVTGERELTRMGPGRYFGEIALVQDSPRTATVTALTRSVVLSITQQNFQRFFEEAPEAIADFEVKLARYDVRLRSVLYHPVGLQFFQEHLKREYSEENLDFWKECRDFRHLSYADIPASAQELEALEREMDAEVEAELRRAAALSSGGQSGPSISTMSQTGPLMHSPRARRQSIARIQGNDVSATFDLFADEAAKAAALAAAEAAGPAAAAAAASTLRDGVMSLDSLVEMLKFFEIPLPSSASDRAGVLLEMAAQLGHEGSLGRPYIPRVRFVRVLVSMENGQFPETARKVALNDTMEQIHLQVEAERKSNRSGDWDQTLAGSNNSNSGAAGAAGGSGGAGTPGALRAHTPGGGSGLHTRDPTSDYLPPDLVSEPALVAGTNHAAAARSLSLASKLLLKLTRLILDLRVAKLVASFAVYDVDRTGSIDPEEFESVVAALVSSGSPAHKEADAARIAASFATLDPADGGSLSVLEFIHSVFVEKKSARALQSIVEARARHIYDTYISDRAPRQVNIRGPAQRKLKAIMEGASAAAAAAAAEAPTPKSGLSAARPTSSPSPTAAAGGRSGWGHRALPSEVPSAVLLQRHEHSGSPTHAGGVPSAHCSGISQSMFDEAEGEIMTLMAADSFSRFKQSELFQSFLMAAGAYNFKGPSLIDETKLKPAAAADKIEANAAAAAAAARAPAPSMAVKAGSGGVGGMSVMLTPNIGVGGGGAASNGSNGLTSGDPKMLGAPKAGAGPGAGGKLRSGSVMLTPRGGPISEDEPHVHVPTHRGSIIVGTGPIPGVGLGVGGPDRSVSARDSGALDADSDAEDFPDGPALDHRDPAIEVEVVALEQFGVDSLVVSPSLNGTQAPPGTAMLMRGHRASLVLPPRGAGGVGVGGVGGSSSGAGGSAAYPGRSSTKSVFYSVGSSPVGADTLRARKGAARKALAGSTFAPPSPPPASTAEEEEPVKAAPPPPPTSTTLANRSPRGPPPPPPAPATPARAVPPPPPAASSSFSTPTPAPAPAPLDTTSPRSSNGSFATPPKSGGGVGAAAAWRNPLQSPAPPRSQPVGVEDKNPMQSPLVGRGGATNGAAAAAAASGPSVPPPPLATLNDADLHKHPLQSPAFQRKRGATEYDSDDEAVPPPPMDPPPS